MREIFISFVISLIFFGLFVYCLDNLQLIDPSKLAVVQEKYGVNTQTEFFELFKDLRDAGQMMEVINQGNLTAMAMVLFGVIFTTFSSIHLFIDKMFFKRFYEKPEILIAMRRSFIFASTFVSFLLMRVFGYLDLLSGSFVLLIAILLEKFFSRPKAKISNELNSEPETENSAKL